jgi:hypothetical protein
VFQSVRYDYIGEYMMREHFTKRKDGEFMGIISRVTSSGRYKPNWVWQKVDPSSTTELEPKQVENVQNPEEVGEEEEELVASEATAAVESTQDKSNPAKKKVIFVKRKTLKKQPSPSPPSPPS